MGVLMSIVPPQQRPEYRMLPTPTAWSQAYWTAGEEGRLLIHRCNACNRFFHPPAPVCFRCRSIGSDGALQQCDHFGRIAA